MWDVRPGIEGAAVVAAAVDAAVNFAFVDSAAGAVASGIEQRWRRRQRPRFARYLMTKCSILAAESEYFDLELCTPTWLI